MWKIIGIIFIICSIGLFMYILYRNSGYSSTTREFSKYNILASSWEQYKNVFINKDGRVLDHSQNDITTSEGQSYAMLRSVWIDDKDTFDLVWKWTKENLERKQDTLFAWRWGQRDDKSFGFLANGGDNSATDADQDIALALIFASSRWNDKAYQNDAKKIITDLWKVNTATANGKRYLIAGNWAQNQQEIVVNPSYFAPYAWKFFAQVDKQHDWNSLVNPAYELLTNASTQPLDKDKGVGLPPDWVVIEKQTGKLKSPTNLGNFTTNYSYDAFRTPWRISLDAIWNNDERAKKYLQLMCQPLRKYYQENQKLATVYSHNGEAIEKHENPAMYATALGCFVQNDHAIAENIYQKKIIALYANDANTFREDISYYEQNWLWFGAALYNNYLIPYRPE